MIVKLDIRILVVLCGLAALTQGGLSLLFASQEARTRALRSVGFAAISMAVALFGMALQGVIPDLFAIVIPKAWGGHGAPVNDPNIAFTEHNMIFTPGGKETKRMVQAPQSTPMIDRLLSSAWFTGSDGMAPPAKPITR